MLDLLDFSKRGNAVLDTAFFAIILVVFVIVCFIVLKINNDVSPEILDELHDGVAKTEYTKSSNRVAPSFDGLVVFAFVLLWILVIVSSFMIDSHPLFFGISFILMIFVFIGAAVIGNSGEELLNDPEFVDLQSEMPGAYWIISNLLMVGVVVGASVLIALFAKNQIG